MKKWTDIFPDTKTWLHGDNQGHYNEVKTIKVKLKVKNFVVKNY